MKFFVDTADIKQIEDLIPTGFIDGVTTNPSLLAKQNTNIKETIKIIEDLRINKKNTIKTYQMAAFKKIIKKQDNIFDNIYDLLRN